MFVLQELKDIKKSGVRPLALSILSVLMVVGSVSLIVMNLPQSAMWDINRKLAEWYPSYLYGLAGLTLVCGFGIWRMRRWAFITYTAILVINQLVLLLINYWGIGSLVQLVIFGGLLLHFFPRTNSREQATAGNALDAE